MHLWAAWAPVQRDRALVLVGMRIGSFRER